MKHPAALCALPLVLLAVAPAIAAPEEITEYLPFREIDRGEISSYLRQHESFSGAELHITDPGSWGEFWAIHTFHQTPKPPLPEVRFPQENVIVVLLGLQTTGGGPSIGVSEIRRGGKNIRITVLEDRTPGPLDVITSPYQIIVTPNLGKSIAFEHFDAGVRLCQDHSDCPSPDHLCSRVDRTCRSPVTGLCRLHPPGSFCPELYMPVCGCDGITYANHCDLELAGAVFHHLGECG